MTERTLFRSLGSIHSSLRVRWFLHSLVIEAAMQSLRLFHVVEAVRRRILRLFLLLLSFVMDTLLVLTLLIWARRVWGGHVTALRHPVTRHVIEL